MIRRPASSFRPPRVVASPALRWVLARSFGPIPESGAAAEPLETEEAKETAELALRLGVGPRIASRVPRSALEGELGPAANALRSERQRILAAELAVLDAARRVAGVAGEVGAPVAFLKFAALRLAGSCREGSRPVADLDVLVSAGQVQDLSRALREAGFAAGGGPGYEHHLPPLFSPGGLPIELHTKVLGLRLGRGRRSAEREDLDARGWLRPLGEVSGASIPCRDLLVAHLLVHALVQHGLAPQAYPPLRLLGDLQDLGFGSSAPLPRAFADGLARDLPGRDLATVARLCDQLAAGDLGSLAASPSESGEARLLHHLLAGALDPDYERSLRLRQIWRPLSDRNKVSALVASMSRAVAPSAAELDAIYGPARGRLPALGRRLLRPWDLLSRAWRSARSASAVRRRDPGEEP